MRLEIIISRGPYRYKKYRSTQEQIDRNEREKAIQRERDERARAEANRVASNDSAPGRSDQTR